MPSLQLCVKWSGPPLNRIFTAGLEGEIYAYIMIDNPSSLKNVCKNDEMVHTDEIMDLLPIPSMGYIVSAGMDKKIALWHMDTLRLKHVFGRGHQHGVHTLDWYADMNMILSAGLDHDIYLWNPQVKPFVFHMKGHNHSLIGVKWVKGTHTVVSADITGMIRVWDMRTYTTTQTLNCSLSEINSLSVTAPPKRIIVGGRSLVFYDYDEPVDHKMADQDACLCVLYNSVFYAFITIHPKCVKIWDAKTGCLQNVFRDISPADLTCMCLDKRKRKLYVGD